MNNKKRLYIYHSFLSRRKDLGQFHSIKELICQLDYIAEMGFNAILTNTSRNNLTLFISLSNILINLLQS